MASTNTRGYGAAHQQLRRNLLPYAYGRPCPRCGQTMLPGQQLDLDHTEDRTSYNGMAHAKCNRSAGAKKATRTRSRKANPTSRRW